MLLNINNKFKEALTGEKIKNLTPKKELIKSTTVTNKAKKILENKIADAATNRTLPQLYEDTIILNKKLSGLFNQTNADNALESLIDLQVLKAYNKIIDKKLGAL
jgi:hypothetical protein